MIDNAQQWLVVGFLVLASAGLFLIWRATSDLGVFSRTWRGLTLGLAMVLVVGVIALVFDLGVLSDAFTSVGAILLIPIWAVMAARQLPTIAS